jgi:anti-sigma regulatory factor (Ser/Thr protein kinase)
VELRVDTAPEAVPRARRAISSCLAEASGPEREHAGDLKLLAGELLTNAVLHGEPPVDLRMLADGGAIRVEVADTSPVPPQQTDSGLDAMTGRGLALVEALATRWGTDLHADGKVVWAELDLAPSASSDQDNGAIAPGAAAEQAQPPATGPVAVPASAVPAREPRYRVRIGDISTGLLVAAKAHVDNLLREFTLAASGSATGEGAAVPAEIVELTGRVISRFAEARQAIRRQAIAAAEAGEARTQLELALPVSAADAAEDYLAALDEADQYARQARLLTLESAPEHRAFRRWYVSAIVAQLRAAAAGQPVPAPASFEEFLRRSPLPPTGAGEAPS